MEELKLKQQNRTELSVKQKKQKEHELVGQLIPHKGHTIWEINNETLEVEKALFANVTYVIGRENKNEIYVREGFSYIAALSKQKALDKFYKGENGSKKMNSEPLSL